MNIRIDLSRLDQKITINDLDQEEIWFFLIGQRVGPRERFCSPFRATTSKNANLSWFNGMLLFGSFSTKDDPWKGFNCVKAFMYITRRFDKYGDALRYLHENFKPIHARKPKRRLIEEKVEKTKSSIFCCFTSWKENTLTFWYNNGINPRNSIIQPIEGFMLNSKLIVCYLITFVYLYQGGEKIYSPFQKKDLKWRGNLSKNTTVWVKNGQDTIIISKSLKDQELHISLFGTNFDYIHSQSERYLFDYDLSGYKLIILVWDSDQTGMEQAAIFYDKLSQMAPVKLVFTGDPETKDSTDLYQKKGRFETFMFLKEKFNFYTL